MMTHAEREINNDITPKGFSTDAINIFKSLIKYISK